MLACQLLIYTSVTPMAQQNNSTVAKLWNLGEVDNYLLTWLYKDGRV